MYKLDAIYGPKSYDEFQAYRKTFKKGDDVDLKPARQKSSDVYRYKPLIAGNYKDLLEKTSFLGVMNKRSSLYFRGQARHYPNLYPAIFRTKWRSLSQKTHHIPRDPVVLQAIYDHLDSFISPLVLKICNSFPMPRRAPLERFREAVWAIAQHYELWPTPLIDITPNLRAAASFALLDSARGYVYVLAMPPSTNSITYEADQHIILARLQAVCPPEAKRPHYQDGFLVGRFPFVISNSNQVDKEPGNVIDSVAQPSDLARRVVAIIELQNEGDFWTEEFPPMCRSSLMPEQSDDKLLQKFLGIANQIDSKFEEIVTSSVVGRH